MAQNHALRSDCPISFCLDMLGDTWSLLIIRDMLFAGKKSFNEFLRSDEGIARNILANRLTQMEAKGIITKHAHATDGRKDVYELTEKGLDLTPILLDMSVWGSVYESRTTVDPQLQGGTHMEREAFSTSIKEKVQGDTR
jgi:DNA-binding HxlR family transcriptional regulator